MSTTCTDNCVFCFIDPQIDGLTDEHFTANDIRCRAIHLAKCLQYEYGIKSGDAVGICSENRIEFAITAFATVTLGATLAPYNTTYTERKLFDLLVLYKFIFINS